MFKKIYGECYVCEIHDHHNQHIYSNYFPTSQEAHDWKHTQFRNGRHGDNLIKHIPSGESYEMYNGKMTEDYNESLEDFAEQLKKGM
jgi:hypothetical protein